MHSSSLKNCSYSSQINCYWSHYFEI